MASAAKSSYNLTLVLAIATLITVSIGARAYQHQHQHIMGIVQQPDLNSPATQEMPTSQQTQLATSQSQQQSEGQQQPRAGEGSMFRYELLEGGSSVRLKWNLRLNQQQHVDYFDLLYGPIPDNAQMFNVSQLDKSRRDYTVHNLEPDTKYQFELRSYQNGRPAQRPELLLVQTPPANQVASMKVAQALAAEIMPLGVKAEPKSASSIQLSWNEPDRPAQIRNSARYNIIRYYATNVNSNEQPRYHYLNVSNPPESRVLISKLRPGTEYAFAVKTLYYTPDMRKLFIQSGFSMDTLGRTYDLEPTPPRNFTIKPLGPPGELHFSWLAPEQTNGQLKGYLILHCPDQQAPDQQWSRIEVNDPNLNNWLVKNDSPQEPGRRFYFKIRAVNQRGQSTDSETRLYVVPPMTSQVTGSSGLPTANNQQPPIPANNLLMLVVICMVAIFFLLSLIVSRLVCRTRKRKPRKGSFNQQQKNQLQHHQQQQQYSAGKTDVMMNGTNSSTVAARVGTLARRRDINKPDFWISAMDQKPTSDTNNLIPAAGASIKPSLSDKSISDLNMAMVSIQRDSPQFATTQLAPALPDYRFASQADQLLQMVPQQQQSHYHSGLANQFAAGPLGYDQMDNATASALMTLSKRQQQQLQKYQIQFATTGAPPPVSVGAGGAQAPSPHQQPPPPPPLNIEQQHQQSIYGSHHQPGGLQSTRSLRLHRPTLYDPVSGSFVQAGQQDPPNYNSHLPTMLGGGGGLSSSPGNQLNSANSFNTSTALNTFQQFQPHQTSTLLSRRSTNTLRSFQTSTANYGQLGQSLNNNNSTTTTTTFAQAPMAGQQQQQPQQLLQSHQAVINQLNQSTYPSLPLKHVSAVRPQIMSSLEDQIEMELAEKEQQEQQQADTTKQ